jgi:hypothetical protein
MKNAVVHNATGSVLQFGFMDFTDTQSNPYFNSATMSQVQVQDDSTVPVVNGQPVALKYVKVLSTQFVEMTALEKATVDAIAPVSSVQRILAPGETIVTTGHASDTTTGFLTVIGGLKTSRPLVAGDYQLATTFEMALTGNAIWDNTGARSAAQARLLFNGTEIQTWVAPLATYTAFSAILGATLAEGAAPTFDLQIRRFGQAGLNARARRVRIEIAPTLTSSIL